MVTTFSSLRSNDLWALTNCVNPDFTAEEAKALQSQEDIKVFESDAAAYISFETFWARCTAAGLDAEDRYRAPFDWQGSFISSTLQPNEELLDYEITAILQLILIAGHVIHAECVAKQLSPLTHPLCGSRWGGWANGNGPAVWKWWGDRLTEILAALEAGQDPGFTLLERNREAFTRMVVEAKDKVVALEPGLFTTSGPEPGTDPASLAAEETNLPQA